MSVVLAGALALSAWRVHESSVAWQPLTRIARGLASGANMRAWGDLLVVVRRGDAFVVRDPNNDSWDEMTRILADESQNAFNAAWVPGLMQREGLYADTSESKRWTITITPLGVFGDVRGELAFEIRNAVLNWERARAPGSRVAELSPANTDTLLRAGDVRVSRPLWSGYLHNALALLGLILFFYSLAWIPRVGPYLTRTRAQRRLARGCCPHCNYAIAGLPEPVCPECGKGWNITAEDDLPASPSAS